MERWLPVARNENYEVSSLGNVRRCRGYNSTRVGRHLKPRDNGNGYLCVRLSQKGRVKVEYVHRLVCHAFHGDPPTKRHQAAHKNGVRSDNAFDNLEWKTARQNEADKSLHGTRLVGELCASSKLTGKTVIEIRKLHSEGVSQKDLRLRFGMSPNGIHSIVMRKTWRHIP